MEAIALATPLLVLGLVLLLYRLEDWTLRPAGSKRRNPGSRARAPKEGRAMSEPSAAPPGTPGPL